MSSINLPVDYTSRDFDGLVADLIARIPDFLPEWTNTGDADFGILLVQLFAYMGDTLNYYIDRIAQEAFLQTATQRQSVLQIAAMLGYTPVQRAAAYIPYVAATSGVQFTISASAGGPVTIPVGTQVLTAAGADGTAPIIFETQTARTIAIGGTDYVDALEGVTTTLETVGQSNGRDSQVFRLANPNVIFGSVSVYVTEGPGTVGSPVNVLWKYFSRLSDAGAIDSAYSLSQDSSNNTYVSFGDSVSGRVPPPGTNILVTYRTGVGSDGNVGANAIVGTVQGVVGVSSVTNNVAAAGGSDPESIDSMRISIPRSVKSLSRAITYDDYANLALQVPGVVRAIARGSWYTNLVIYVAPSGGGAPSTTLKNAVVSYITPLALVGVTLAGGNPVYIGANIAVTVNVLAQYNQASVLAAVQSAMTVFFLFDNRQFNELISVGDVYHLLQNVVGVDYVTITQMVRADASNQSIVENLDPAATSTHGTGVPQNIFQKGTFTLTGVGGIT